MFLYIYLLVYLPASASVTDEQTTTIMSAPDSFQEIVDALKRALATKHRTTPQSVPHTINIQTSSLLCSGGRVYQINSPVHPLFTTTPIVTLPKHPMYHLYSHFSLGKLYSGLDLSGLKLDLLYSLSLGFLDGALETHV